MSGSSVRVLAITSGKGGVGKSHSTINLGVALHNIGHKVLILDADLGLANINVLLGFEPAGTIDRVLSHQAAIDDIIVHHESGLDIIPAASGLPHLTQLSEGERLRLLEALEQLASAYDFLLIDTAAGIGDNVLYFTVAAEEVVVVVNHEPTSITDAYALIKVLSTKHGIKKFSVLVNSVPIGADGRTTYAQLAAATDKFLTVKLSYLGGVAEDPLVVESTLRQRPYSMLYPSTKASLDIGRIAKRIAESPGDRSAHGGMQFFLRQLVSDSSR